MKDIKTALKIADAFYVAISASALEKDDHVFIINFNLILINIL